MICRLVLVFCLFAAMAAMPAGAAEKELARIDRMDVGDVEMGGFILDADGRVSIEAVGWRGRGTGDDFRFSNAWILNADTRKVVWSLRQADADKLSKYLLEYTDDPKLPQGRYEVYYSTYPSFSSHSDDIDVQDFGDFVSNSMENAFGKDVDYDDYKEEVREFYVVVRGEGTPLGDPEVRDFHKALGSNAVVSLTALGNDTYETVGLTLDRPMELQIYAIGEVREGEGYDYCWISDTETHKKVWRFEYKNSIHAGGAEKNRVFKGGVWLPAGSYALYCVTDDSHAFDAWNSPPPHDPYFWGVSCGR
jgi:hypothetical protein